MSETVTIKNNAEQEMILRQEIITKLRDAVKDGNTQLITALNATINIINPPRTLPMGMDSNIIAPNKGTYLDAYDTYDPRDEG